MAMGFSDVLWVFLMVTGLQPILKQKLLEMRRLRLLVQLEKRRGSRVIALVHRQETMSILGFPLMRYIDVNDSEEVLRAIKLTDTSRPIDLIMHTPGGLVLADKLSRGGWTHDYPITAEEAKALGLPVSTEVPEEIYEFMSLFPQPTRTRPSVEYIPIPYRGRQGPQSGG